MYGHKTLGRGKYVAREGQKSVCKGVVTYGARNKWVQKKQNGKFSCTNGVFGDPIVGTVKACYCHADE